MSVLVRRPVGDKESNHRENSTDNSKRAKDDFSVFLINHCSLLSIQTAVESKNMPVIIPNATTFALTGSLTTTWLMTAPAITSLLRSKKYLAKFCHRRAVMSGALQQEACLRLFALNLEFFWKRVRFLDPVVRFSNPFSPDLPCKWLASSLQKQIDTPWG